MLVLIASFLDAPAAAAANPTDPFTILESQNPSIDKVYVAQTQPALSQFRSFKMRRTTFLNDIRRFPNLEALRLRKIRSGKCPSTDVEPFKWRKGRSGLSILLIKVIYTEKEEYIKRILDGFLRKKKHREEHASILEERKRKNGLLFLPVRASSFNIIIYRELGFLFSSLSFFSVDQFLFLLIWVRKQKWWKQRRRRKREKKNHSS